MSALMSSTSLTEAIDLLDPGCAETFAKLLAEWPERLWVAEWAMGCEAPSLRNQAADRCEANLTRSAAVLCSREGLHEDINYNTVIRARAEASNAMGAEQ